MREKEILNVILKNHLQWNKVNKQPCIHTFYREYYINLCLWEPQGIKTISIDVDDIEKGIDNLISLNIKEGDSEFKNLLHIYSSSKDNAINIAA